MAVKDVSQAAIADLLSLTLIANKKRDITGCIIFHEGEFLHFIEGGLEKVLSLYAKISNDHRHERITLLHSSATEKRFLNSNLVVGDTILKEKGLAGCKVMTAAEISAFVSKVNPKEPTAKFFVELVRSMFA